MQIQTETTVSGRVFNAASQTAPIGMLVEGKNPRTFFDPAEMAELEASILAQGVLQPILVRVNEAGHLEVVAGGRRFRAAKAVLGPSYEMPIHFKALSQDEADAAAVIENHHRADVSPTEEAFNAAKLLQRFSGDRDEVAKYLGWSRSVLDNRLALMALSASAQTALNERKIALGVAELLATITKENQDKALPLILSNSLTVSDVKAFIQKKAKEMAKAIFPKDECANCQHNSDLQSSLFSENLGSGSCSNAVCYDAKTEAELERRRTLLLDAFPQVKIIRPGDNFTVIRITEDGKSGVGPEQAQACKACANYGGAVSAMPDTLGKDYKGQCFDTACNKTKVAAYAKSLLPVAKAPSTSTEKVTSAKVPAAGDKPSEPAVVKAPLTSVSESPRIKEYREGIWRAALKKDLASQSEKSLSLLFGLAAIRQIQAVDATKIHTALGTLSGEKMPELKDICAIAKVSEKITPEKRIGLLNGLTRSAVDTVPIHVLVEMMRFMEVDLKQHWKIDAEFLKILTKSEIEVVASDIGLKKHLDNTFSSLMSKPKDDFIKHLLTCDFSFDAIVPKVMDYAK